MDLDFNVIDLLRKRYFLKDADGNYLENTWSDICWRVGKNIASVETDEELKSFYESAFCRAMLFMDILPSSPVLFNAGTPLQQLSSCFIIDIDDNMESIAEAWKEASLIFKSGGGVGFNISSLRPKGALVKSSNGEASGPISFMKVFNTIVEQVKQGGRRKGAIKVDLNVEHPDIIDFIHCKDNTTELNNMNISVSISDAFMEAVENDKDWPLVFNDQVYKVVKARDLWIEIIKSAWATGEPGLSFRDTMDRANPNPHLGRIWGSNPCMEFVNIPYSSCNLASINLDNMVEDGELKWEKITYYVRLLVRFLDNMIEVNKLPLKKIEEVTKLIRPIGIGTMGYANMLYKLGLRYGSEAALKLTEQLYAHIYKSALMESQELAKERGTYPGWKGSKWEAQGILIRNSSLLSIAPNGSIAFIAQTTGGIEPEFALVYQRTTNEGTKYLVTNKVFENELKRRGLYSQELIEQIYNSGGSIQHLDLPDDLKKVFVVAHDITPEEHLKTLAVVQKHVDMSVSKTINLPKEATVKDVADIYQKAWQLGIKGVTVYRDGSRPEQVLSTGTTSISNNSIKVKERGYIEAARLKATGIRLKLNTGCGSLWLSAFLDDDNNIVEIFTDIGQGNCISNTQALSRMISLALRGGISLDDIVDQLQSACTCPSYAVAKAKGKDVSPGKSCPSAIAHALLDLQRELKQQVIKSSEAVFTVTCPQCNSMLTLESGCWSCKSCGYSKCN